MVAGIRELVEFRQGHEVVRDPLRAGQLDQGLLAAHLRVFCEVDPVYSPLGAQRFGHRVGAVDNIRHGAHFPACQSSSPGVWRSCFFRES